MSSQTVPTIFVLPSTNTNERTLQATREMWERVIRNKKVSSFTIKSIQNELNATNDNVIRITVDVNTANIITHNNGVSI